MLAASPMMDTVAHQKELAFFFLGGVKPP